MRSHAVAIVVLSCAAMLAACGGVEPQPGAAGEERSAPSVAQPNACQCQPGCPACVDPRCGGGGQAPCPANDRVTQTCFLCGCDTYARTCTAPACNAGTVYCLDGCAVAWCLEASFCQSIQRRSQCL